MERSDELWKKAFAGLNKKAEPLGHNTDAAAIETIQMQATDAVIAFLNDADTYLSEQVAAMDDQAKSTVKTKLEEMASKFNF